MCLLPAPRGAQSPRKRSVVLLGGGLGHQLRSVLKLPPDRVNGFGDVLGGGSFQVLWVEILGNEIGSRLSYVS